MRNAHGYAVVTDPDAKGPVEYDTVTCGHCGHLDHVQSGQRPEDLGGFCKCCMSLICKECVGKDCRPLMQWIEEVERQTEREIALRSYGFN